MVGVATIVVDQIMTIVVGIATIVVFATILVGVATIVVDCDNCEHCDNCDHITCCLQSCQPGVFLHMHTSESTHTQPESST